MFERLVQLDSVPNIETTWISAHRLGQNGTSEQSGLEEWRLHCNVFLFNMCFKSTSGFFLSYRSER